MSAHPAGYRDEDLTPEERVVHAAMAEVGLVEPFFADVPDGYYTQRVVLDSLPEARFWRDGGEPPPVFSDYHLEPCRIPRTRRELRWRVARIDSEVRDCNPDEHSLSWFQGGECGFCGSPPLREGSR